MKKNRLLLLSAILALASLSGCGKNDQNKQLENDLAVTGVTLNVTYASVEAGESITLEPTIHFKDDNPVECYTEWRSNNQKVATVSEGGAVLALKSGYAAITFIAGYKSASCSITVPSHDVTPVTPVDPDNPVIPGEFTISLNANSINLAEGSSFKLDATTSEQAEVTWTSSNPSVATVNEVGLVMGVAEGDAVITATANGKTATCEVSVVYVDPDEEELPPSDDMTVHVYFFIDYNNVDESDLTGTKCLAKFWWYEDKPIAESGMVPANPTKAPISAFPYFAGWSTHPIIDSRDGLLDLSTYKVSDDGSRSFLYIYGIWTDVQGGM